MNRMDPACKFQFAAPREDAIEAFNQLSEVIDFLGVIGMALASETCDPTFSGLATVVEATRQHALAGFEAADRVCRYYAGEAQS